MSIIKELAAKSRSYRRFYGERQITREMLVDLVDTARLTPSGANKQPVRYVISYEHAKNELIFETLRWAGYYSDWDGPEAGERPSGYIVLVEPKGSNAAWDEGIIGQTILLAAVEKGLGGCFIANIDREKLEANLKLPENYSVKLVIALGYPKEEVVVETINAGDDIKYYRDSNQVHHVPKIKLEDLIY